MSQENVDIVLSLYEPWERGDFSSVAWAHPDIEWVIADGPAPGSWKGVAGMVQGWREFLGAWEDWHLEVEEDVRELDDGRVLALFRFAARGKASGLEVGDLWTRGAALYTLRAGKVTRLVIYWDRERALEAVGLSE
jgi:ketosteroid isomerase-like protein